MEPVVVVEESAPELQSDTSSSATPPMQPGALLRHFKGPAARGFVPPPFVQPDGIAIDRERNRIIIADSANHRVVSLHRVSLEVMWQFGAIGESGTGNKRLHEPRGCVMTLDSQLVLVVDCNNHRVVSLRADDGSFVSSFGSRGTGPEQFRNPTGIAIGPDARVWISDTNNHRVQCYRDADSWLHVRQLGKTDDPGSTPEQFNRPLHLAVADDGRLFVADSLNHRVQMVDAVSQRAFVKSIGPIPNKKQLALSSLASPAAVFIAGGVLYIGDSGNHRVSAFDVESLQSIGTIGEIGMSPGQFLGIRAVAVDVVDRELFVTNWNGPQAVTVFSSFEIDQGSAQL